MQRWLDDPKVETLHGELARRILATVDRERATAGLRGQLRLMAMAAGSTPDWSTLTVSGPSEALGARGRSWFGWTATVEVAGGELLLDSSVEALLVPLARGERIDVSQPLA